jgi:hypothetical protein
MTVTAPESDEQQGLKTFFWLLLLQGGKKLVE